MVSKCNSLQDLYSFTTGILNQLCKGAFKKYVCSKFPIFDPLPHLFVSAGFTCTLTPQRTFALVSYAPLKKKFRDVHECFKGKIGVGKERKELIFVQTQHKSSMFFTQLYIP